MEASVSSMDGSINSSPNARSTAPQSVDELKQMLVCTKLELESARAAAKAQAQVHKVKVAQLEEMLRSARKERDEALQKYMELQNNINVCSSSISSCSLFIAEDANTRNNAGSPLDNSFNDQSSDWLNFSTKDDLAHSSEDFSFSGFEDYGLEVTTMEAAAMNPPVLITSTYFDNVTAGGGYSTSSSSSWLQNGNALASILAPLQHQQAERGKLLQAVMQAGPLLHTLLLAGPLPQWHHPPPVLDHLNSFQFPVPSIVSGSFGSSASHSKRPRQLFNSYAKVC